MDDDLNYSIISRVLDLVYTKLGGVRMKIITTDELLKMLDKHKFKQFHIHHTWKPEHKDFNGNNHMRLQESMKNYHINSNGWSDIGQHISVFPDGKIVTGRPFGTTPASIKGWNTNAFAMETIGNFDIGHDKLEGKQLETVLRLIKYFIENYGQGAIKFHREGPGVTKSCPGTSLNKTKLIAEAISLDKKEVVKVDKNKPADWAKKDWEWAKKEGYLDGTRPLDNITRQELAVLTRRIVDKK